MVALGVELIDGLELLGAVVEAGGDTTALLIGYYFGWQQQGEGGKWIPWLMGVRKISILWTINLEHQIKLKQIIMQ